MTLLTLPKQGIPITTAGAVVGADWYRWASDVTERCGGVTGPGTNDLAAAQFEDAGIAEQLEMIGNLEKALWQAESLVHSLAARLDEVERELMALKQGVLL
jgi:hypothetical protein